MFENESSFRLQENDEEEEDGIGAEEEPLCSDDDVSDEENQNDLFDTENVVVCQYDKVMNFLFLLFSSHFLFKSFALLPNRLHDHVTNGNSISKMAS